MSKIVTPPSAKSDVWVSGHWLVGRCYFTCINGLYYDISKINTMKWFLSWREFRIHLYKVINTFNNLKQAGNMSLFLPEFLSGSFTSCRFAAAKASASGDVKWTNSSLTNDPRYTARKWKFPFANKGVDSRDTLGNFCGEQLALQAEMSAQLAHASLNQRGTHGNSFGHVFHKHLSKPLLYVREWARVVNKANRRFCSLLIRDGKDKF